MASINRAGNSGSGFPINTESTELGDLVRSTEAELKQSSAEPSQPETRKKSVSAEGEPQVTGRRAAVKLGAMAQQNALFGKLAKNSSAPASGKQSIGKEEDPPPPANATQKTADKIYDKIKSQIPDLKGLRTGQYPELSKEEQLAADFGAGIAKYKEYVDYAKKGLEKLKNMPDGPVKEQFKKMLGDRLDGLSKFIDGTGAALNKVTKYADMVKDAAGIMSSVRDLAADVKNMDFKNPASVEKVMDSLGKSNDRVQKVLGGIAQDLLTNGTKVGATGALVMAYVGFTITAGIELGRAGVKAEKEYYEKYVQRLRIIENGGVDPRPMQPLPNEPAPLKTYQQLHDEEQDFYRGAVRTMVDSEFRAPRQQVAKEFDKKHTEVRDKFTNEEFPKMYLQKRDQILNQLKAAKHEYESNYNTGNNKERFANIEWLAGMINRMESHKELSPAQVENEVNMFRDESYAPGPVRTMLNRTYSKELEKYYEQKGVGDGALEKAYENAGVSDQIIEKMEQEKLHEAGLD